MFLIAMAVLILQISITRVMSVTVGYHSAFIVIAVVMLGLAASAVRAFVHMNRDNPVTATAAIGGAYRAALLTALVTMVYVHVVARDWGPLNHNGIRMTVAAMLFYLPFDQCGYAIAILLRHYAKNISRLYWFDLAGAAAGCLLAIPLLNATSALNVLLGCALLAGVAGLLLSREYRRWKWLTFGGGLSFVLAGLLLVALLVVPELTRIPFAKGLDQRNVLWQSWNSLARVSVLPAVPGLEQGLTAYQSALDDASFDPDSAQRLLQAGWGMSRVYRGHVPPILWLQLDTDAGTQIVKQSPTEELEFLGWDVTAAGYWLTPQPDRVFVVGGGGGRDVLVAQVFQAGQIDVAELNPDVIDAVEEVFASFSGRPYSAPNVTLKIGDARRHLTNRDDQYDLIQMSMIDTWAASMSGTLVLSENALYTMEAFDLYLESLKPNGVLSISRWYDARQFGETARVISLMGTALRNAGIQQPENHIAVLLNKGYFGGTIATCLLSKSPLTSTQIRSLADVAARMQFTLVWPADVQPDVGFDVPRVARGELEGLAHFDLSPPTDDRPFFFNLKRPLAGWIKAIQTGDMQYGSESILILLAMFLAMALASRLFVFRPLQNYHRQQQAQHADSNHRTTDGRIRFASYFFAGIGVGFILVEMALIQRYIVYLGHPTYAITIVLFTLLLFSGLGSYFTARFDNRQLGTIVRWSAGCIILAIALTAWAVPGLLANTRHWPDAARIAMSMVLVAPAAFCMGMLLPYGMRCLSQHRLDSMIPWMWGLNGVFGVMGTIIGTAIALFGGYTLVFAAAVAAYLVAWVSMEKLRPGEVTETTADA